MVQVTPQKELRPNRIAAVDYAVTIGVILGQCFEPVLGELSVLQWRKVAEQLRTACDPAVVVAVEPQECLIWADRCPAHEHRMAVAAHVEGDWRVRTS